MVVKKGDTSFWTQVCPVSLHTLQCSCHVILCAIME